MEKDPFEKYKRETEPGKREKGYAWHTAVGLQAVDGLKPSEYLLTTAKRNIEGEISIEKANELIHAYYEENPDKSGKERTEEADKVSARIAQILSEKSFVFSPAQYLSIHKRLFEGIYAHAGKIRKYNITKEEWVLDGDTVLYGGASELNAMLEYDFNREREFSYEGLSIEQVIHHLAAFVSNLWQIHVFGEGNTRTTAVFFIKYLRTLGFEVQNDNFAEHAWYFRNALVRANYNNLKKNVHETTMYLEVFLRNLLLDEQNELHSRTMHISGLFGGSTCREEAEEYRVDYKYKMEQERKNMSIKAVLFDLDGTLLPMDYDGFIKLYFGNLAKRLAKYGYDPDELIKNVWAGTKEMVMNDGSCMNETRFWDFFVKIYGINVLQDKVLFDDFYREEFGKAKEACGFAPLAKEVVEEVKRKGFFAVLATNPIFPMVATRQRMEWAGVSPEDFALCTTYENIGYSKPNPAYYAEIAKRIGVTPEECLMVGNDVSEDMVAAKTGMQVFLLTDCLLNKKEEDISAYPQGGFRELLEYIKTL